MKGIRDATGLHEVIALLQARGEGFPIFLAVPAQSTVSITLSYWGIGGEVDVSGLWLK